MKICILVSAVNLSGGIYVIFQHACYLQNQGIDVTIVTTHPVDKTHKWHPAFDTLKFLTLEEAEAQDFDLAIATWWETVYALPRIRAKQYTYFVQGMEDLFYVYKNTTLRDRARATYRLPFKGITVSSWLRKRLKEHYGLDLHLVTNGMAKNIHNENGPAYAPRQKGKLRVLVEGPLGDYSGKNVARAVHLLRQTLADEIWLLTTAPISSYPGVDRVISRIPPAECPKVYRSCDVLIKLSADESFALPILEMFHSGGTAVLFDIPGPQEFVKKDFNALVIDIGDEAGVIQAINRLKEEPELLSQLQEGARETARKWPDWPAVSAQFHKAVKEIMDAPHVSREELMRFIKDYDIQDSQTHTQNATLAQRLIASIKAVVRAIKSLHPKLDSFFYILRARLSEERRLDIPDQKIISRYF